MVKITDDFEGLLAIHSCETSPDFTEKVMSNLSYRSSKPADRSTSLKLTLTIIILVNLAFGGTYFLSFGQQNEKDVQNAFSESLFENLGEYEY